MYTLKSKRVLIVLGSVFLLLLIPFTAMQITPEVSWTHEDFFVAGSILLSAGLGVEVCLRAFKKPQTKWMVIMAILLLVLFIWVGLAVDIAF